MVVGGALLPPGTDKPVIGANEVRLPAGQTGRGDAARARRDPQLLIPNLAGKTDMIPGRVNRMVIQAETPGVFRGQCAEYCGGPHALMAFYAVAMTPPDFEAWLEREARPATAPEEEFLARGHELFLESGCGTCHTIRGTPANGQLGPDLTHVGGRVSLGAGILPNNVGSIAGWIAHTQHIKPDNLMPSFDTPGQRVARARGIPREPASDAAAGTHGPCARRRRKSAPRKSACSRSGQRAKASPTGRP